MLTSVKRTDLLATVLVEYAPLACQLSSLADRDKSFFSTKMKELKGE